MILALAVAARQSSRRRCPVLRLGVVAVLPYSRISVRQSPVSKARSPYTVPNGSSWRSGQTSGAAQVCLPCHPSELCGAYLAGRRVHYQMGHAVLAQTLRAVPARRPPLASDLHGCTAATVFPHPEDPAPGAVHQQDQRTQAALRLNIRAVIRFRRRLRVETSGTGQLRPAIDSILSTIPVVCRSGSSDRTFTMRHGLNAAAGHLWPAASASPNTLPG